jgi:1,4-alpha-glucan branching enzyme
MQEGLEFRLFAPYNPAVQLIGDWNNWQPVPMTRGEDGWWRVTVPLPDGEYWYKFRLISNSYFQEGEWVEVADPCSMGLTTEEDEKSILRVRNGHAVISSYDWHKDYTPLPPNQQLVIYEIHVADFSGGAGDTVQGRQGTFQDVIDKLDYLVDLGVNAIELMPCNEYPGIHDLGYSQRSVYAVENNFGSPDDLCHLVDECHARGIRVIADMVYNHMDKDAPLAQIDYSYWFHRENPDDPMYHFGPKFNYEHYDEKLKVWPARKHIIEAMRLWIDTFRLDGIRFDCTRAIQYFELLRWFREEGHARVSGKPFYTVAEHMPPDASICGPEGPVDAAWHERLYNQLTAIVSETEQYGHEPYNTDQALYWLDGQKFGFCGPEHTVVYLENHDHERAMRELMNAGVTGERAFRRLKLGATLLLTAPGVPMLWMGQEFGESATRTRDYQPIHWSLLREPCPADLREHYKRLIHLRKDTPALTSDSFEPVANLPERGIIAYKRRDEGGSTVLVVANLKDEDAGSIDLGMIENGEWREAVSGYAIAVENGTLKDRLGPSQAKVYVKVD